MGSAPGKTLLQSLEDCDRVTFSAPAPPSYIMLWGILEEKSDPVIVFMNVQ